MKRTDENARADVTDRLSIVVLTLLGLAAISNALHCCSTVSAVAIGPATGIVGD
jgi:hypothetical protein